MPESSTAFNPVSAAELSASTGAGFLLDVRSPIEFAVEHINGAVNIPLPELEGRAGEVPRDRRLFVICRSGKRAARAAYLLAGQGYEPSVLTGGVLAWRAAGLPLIEGKKRLPIERQIQLIVGTGSLCGVVLGLTVSPWFFILPGFFSAGLTFAGLTGTCGLGILLEKAPWNQLDPGCGKTEKKNSCCS